MYGSARNRLTHREPFSLLLSKIISDYPTLVETKKVGNSDCSEVGRSDFCYARRHDDRDFSDGRRRSNRCREPKQGS